MDYFSKKQENAMLRKLSLSEFALLAATYKGMFKDQLREPTADNNHIINYNLKLQNYLMVNSSIHMISAGMFAFFIKSIVGNKIDRVCLNYLGSKRGQYAQIAFYILSFYSTFTWLNHRSRLNVSHLINPRDFNGELMMNIMLKYFPNKINQDRYRQVLMDKYESQLLKITSFEQMMGEHDQHYKLANPDAVSTYIQQSAPQQQEPEQQPSSMPVMPGSPQFPNMQQALQGGHQPQHTTTQIAQSYHHAQDAQLNKIVHAAPPTQGQSVSQPNQDQQQSDLQTSRTRIVDQMRDHQAKSPYLSTNPLLVQQTQPNGEVVKTSIASPYFIAQQEISKASPNRMNDAMENYYMQNIAAPDFQAKQKPTFRYQGHYSNVSQQAQKDSS